MSRSRPKLLVIDDEPNIGDIVAFAAGKCGYETQYAGNLEAFTEHFSVDIDVVVLDIFMPGTDGIEFIRFLGNIRSSVALILISGVDRSVLNSAQDLAVEQGLLVLGALAKLFKIARLADLLASHEFEHARARRRDDDAPTLDELKQAITAGELVMNYQPQLSLADGAPVGVETLVRWRHPTRGLLGPSQFVPLAEQSGLIDDLSDHILRAALKQCAEWRAEGLAVRVSVNMSAMSFEDLDFPEILSNSMAEFGLTPSRLVIEVTETAVMTDLTKSLDILTRLRMKGFTLSIDDFGTGHSSLRQLVKIPFAELKIDQSFVKHMIGDSDCRTIARISIALAHELGMYVVGEGIENQEIQDALASFGCDQGQGFWIARPMPGDEVGDWYRANTRLAVVGG